MRWPRRCEPTRRQPSARNVSDDRLRAGQRTTVNDGTPQSGPSAGSVPIAFHAGQPSRLSRPARPRCGELGDQHTRPEHACQQGRTSRRFRPTVDMRGGTNCAPKQLGPEKLPDFVARCATGLQVSRLQPARRLPPALASHFLGRVDFTRWGPKARQAGYNRQRCQIKCGGDFLSKPHHLRYVVVVSPCCTAIFYLTFRPVWGMLIQ